MGNIFKSLHKKGFRMKNILITGGAGFIGYHLVKHYVKDRLGYDYRYAIDISKIKN